MSAKTYLTYDIPSIQKFIFSVPKLKCIIGASSQVVLFDQLVEKKWATEANEVNRIFSGGGKGTFLCDSGHVDGLKESLSKMAHAHGMDIRFGTGALPKEAVDNTDSPICYFPPPVTGTSVPCSLSGLYPVAKGSDSGQEIHPIIAKRVALGQNDLLGKSLLDRKIEIDGVEQDNPYRKIIFSEQENDLSYPNSAYAELDHANIEFIKNVTVERDDSEHDQERQRAGAAAVGNRNRWAVITMDGNAIGKLFEKVSGDDEKYRKLSEGLKGATMLALCRALGNVLHLWTHDLSSKEFAKCGFGKNKSSYLIPFRPLLVGGDDIAIICHSSYAMTFATEMANLFTEECEKSQQIREAIGETPELTMSAGILYCKTSFPLHKAIDYAGQLLDNAKDKYRGQKGVSAVDWDHITNSLLEDPETKRRRELEFFDGDLDAKIQLTMRPYRMDRHDEKHDVSCLTELNTKLQGKRVSKSVLSKLQVKLRQPMFERLAFLASIGKRHSILQSLLWQTTHNDAGDGWIKLGNDTDTIFATQILDAMSIANEEKRMQQNTQSNAQEVTS